METSRDKRKSSPIQASDKKRSGHDRRTSGGRDAQRHAKKRLAASRSEVEYAVIFEKSRSGYGAYVPDLPGCVATGKTLEKVRRLIREAVQLHLEGMRQDGERIPEPTSIANAIRVAL